MTSDTGDRLRKQLNQPQQTRSNEQEMWKEQ
jgi:hypothetical protein